jgi:hypothetical protein
MTVFAVTSIGSNPGLGDKIASVYGTNNYKASDTLWFVADDNVTPAQVCEKIGVRSPSLPTGFEAVVVFRIQGYFGFANNAVWQWLTIKGAVA